MAEVLVYSAADEVELRLNGTIIGREKAHFTAKFSVPYMPSVLEAVSFTDGKEVSRDTLKTFGKPAKLKLTPEQTEIIADGQSLCFVKIEAADGDGNPLPYVEEPVTAEATGAALLALGTGRGCTEENYTSGTITLYKGAALAVLRTGSEPGEITLSVTSANLGTAAINLTGRNV